MRPIFYFCSHRRRPEEFDGILNQLDRPYVKFYDHDNRWYMDSTWKDKIQEALDAFGQPVLSLGCSMGGWACLYYQSQIKADKVVAFMPQATTISEEIKNIGGEFSKKWAADLKNVNGCRLPPATGPNAVYFGEYGNSKIGDATHKKIISDLGYQIITILNVPNPEKHNFVKHLHDQGVLVDMIKLHLDNSFK